MKILLVAERYYPEVGAAPTRLSNMAEGLCEQGVEVDVLTSLPNYPTGRIFDGYRHRLFKHEKVNGCNVFRYWIFATVSRNAVKRLLNMISFAITIWLFAFRIKRCSSYDRVIIQTPTLIVAISAMWLFKLLYRKKCLVNISDIWPSTAVDMGVMKEGSASWKVMTWCEKYLYRHADGVIGQSQEILDRVEEVSGSTTRRFLYRNLSRQTIDCTSHQKGSPLKICFAGMLGVAQDILSIVQKVDFKVLGVEFHIIGGGNQYETLCQWVEMHPNCNVVMHGFVAKEKMADIYRHFDAAIVPLATRIRGAFPSKVFDILPMGLPVLLCGEGEVAQFVEDHHVGFVCKPADYDTLRENIIKLRDMDADSYRYISSACISTTRQELNFKAQMKNCYSFLISHI
jgi:glycosyltransferase involved in cell wall biosynthesis